MPGFLVHLAVSKESLFPAALETTRAEVLRITQPMFSICLRVPGPTWGTAGTVAGETDRVHILLERTYENIISE